jgi:hypothetical protein
MRLHLALLLAIAHGLALPAQPSRRSSNRAGYARRTAGERPAAVRKPRKSTARWEREGDALHVEVCHCQIAPCSSPISSR